MARYGADRDGAVSSMVRANPNLFCILYFVFVFVLVSSIVLSIRVLDKATGKQG